MTQIGIVDPNSERHARLMHVEEEKNRISFGGVCRCWVGRDATEVKFCIYRVMCRSGTLSRITAPTSYSWRT